MAEQTNKQVKFLEMVDPVICEIVPPCVNCGSTEKEVGVASVHPKVNLPLQIIQSGWRHNGLCVKCSYSIFSSRLSVDLMSQI